MKSHGLATYCRSSSFSATAQTCSRFGMCWRPICHFSQTTVISLWLRRLCRFLFILVIIFIQLHCILVTILFRYFLLFQLKCYLNEGTKHSMVFFAHDEMWVWMQRYRPQLASTVWRDVNRTLSALHSNEFCLWHEWIACIVMPPDKTNENENERCKRK